MELRKFSTPINFVIFQICWFGCVLGAAHNLEWLGPFLVLITGPLQIHYLTEHRKQELLFLLVCGVGGFLIETLMIVFGVYIPVSGVSAKVCPPWMAALWFNFAPLVSISLSWLKGKYLLAAVLGGLAGPVAYWGGDKLEALLMNQIFTAGYVILFIVWALVLPLLVYMHARITLPR